MKTKNILLVIASVLFVGTKVNAQMGNQCNITPPLNPLTSDWQIPLGGYNFNLTEGANTASSLFLGFPACNPPLPARFGVHNDVHQVAGAFVSTVTNTPTAVGVYSSIVNSGTNVEAIGVHS